MRWPAAVPAAPRAGDWDRRGGQGQQGTRERQPVMPCGGIVGGHLGQGAGLVGGDGQEPDAGEGSGQAPGPAMMSRWWRADRWARSWARTAWSWAWSRRPSAPLVTTMRPRPGRQYTRGRSSSRITTPGAGPGRPTRASVSSCWARRRRAVAMADTAAQTRRPVRASDAAAAVPPVSDSWRGGVVVAQLGGEVQVHPVRQAGDRDEQAGQQHRYDEGHGQRLPGGDTEAGQPPGPRPRGTATGAQPQATASAYPASSPGTIIVTAVILLRRRRPAPPAAGLPRPDPGPPPGGARWQPGPGPRPAPPPSSPATYSSRDRTAR